jgi:hypothetical protein
MNKGKSLIIHFIIKVTLLVTVILFLS